MVVGSALGWTIEAEGPTVEDSRLVPDLAQVGWPRTPGVEPGLTLRAQLARAPSGHHPAW